MLDSVAANICVYFSIYLCIFVSANIVDTIFLKPRFKIDAVIMIICSIVIIINSVWTLRNKGCVHPHLTRFIPEFRLVT